MIYAFVIAILLSFGGGWKVNEWRHADEENERAKQVLLNVRLSAASDIRRLDNIIGAQNRAVARMAVLRRDADSSRWAIIRLSDAASSALRSAQDSQSSCLKSAAALADVLGTMATAGGEIAAQADRHASDTQTLIESWPN